LILKLNEIQKAIIETHMSKILENINFLSGEPFYEALIEIIERHVSGIAGFKICYLQKDEKEKRINKIAISDLSQKEICGIEMNYISREDEIEETIQIIKEKNETIILYKKRIEKKVQEIKAVNINVENNVDVNSETISPLFSFIKKENQLCLFKLKNKFGIEFLKGKKVFETKSEMDIMFLFLVSAMIKDKSYFALDLQKMIREALKYDFIVPILIPEGKAGEIKNAKLELECFEKYGSLLEFIKKRSFAKITPKLRKLPIFLISMLSYIDFYDEDNFVLKWISENTEKFCQTIIKTGIMTFTKFELAICISRAEGLAYEKISGVPFGMRARRINKSQMILFGIIQGIGKRRILDIFEMAAEIGCRNVLKRVLECKDKEDLQKLHDKFTEKMLKKMTPEDTQLNIDKKFNPVITLLKAHKNIEVIDNAKRLFEEGSRMKNCVYSRRKNIESGKCIILSVKYSNELFTVEISEDLILINKFCISECRGYRNSVNENSKTVETMINEIINPENSMAIAN
jgi:cpp50